MTYIGLPPFYPPGWFWIGGRLAALTGTPAWEMFKPWSIVSITIAIVLAFVLWANMIRFEYALVVSTATAAAALAYSPAEPYAAIIAVLLPPVFVLAWSGCVAGRVAAGRSAATREWTGGWAAIVGTGAVPRSHRAVLHAAAGSTPRSRWRPWRCCWPSRRRQLDPLLRLLVIAVISGLIAADQLGPYLLAAARGTPADTGTAQHYLPVDGAQLSFPMLQFTLLGALCMLGTVWLVVYARTSTRAGALAVAVLTVYAWSLLSMLTTLAGTTLLSFRLQPTLTILLTAAGAFGFIEATRAVAARVQQPNARRVVAVATADRRPRRRHLQPGHPRRAALRHRRRLHRHRRRRPARRPSPTRAPSGTTGRSTPGSRR